MTKKNHISNDSCWAIQQYQTVNVVNLELKLLLQENENKAWAITLVSKDWVGQNHCIIIGFHIADMLFF